MEIEEMKNKLEKTIKVTDERLKDNKEWLNIFDNYADDILKGKEKKEELSKHFKMLKPFSYYVKFDYLIKSASTLYVDVRYLGHTVATITVSDKNGVVVSTKGYEVSNREFECTKELINKPWNGKDASEFRKVFKKFDNQSIDYKKKVRQKFREETKEKHRQTGNKEHEIQNLLFSEFLKENSKDKLLCGIQPVTVANYFFAMKTPLKASLEEIVLAANNGASGGGIDILARTSGGKLTVIEVKDEYNESKEPIEKVLSQATAYATSIIYMLRNSINADKWYKTFGYKRPLPKSPLTIRVCSAMPLKKDGSCEKFKSFKLNYGNDILEYHWIYFEEQDGALLNIDSDLNKKQYDN